MSQSGTATSKAHDLPWSTHLCDQLSRVPTIQDYSVPFSGSAPYEFIQGYEEFFKVNPMTEVDMIQYVIQDFEGEALEWYYQYVEGKFLDTWTPDCWEDFVIELYRKFACEHQLFVERTETEIVKVSESKSVGNGPSEVVYNLFARMLELVKNIEQQNLREKFVEDEGVRSKINCEFNFLQTMMEYVDLHQALRCDFDLWNYRLNNGLNFGFDPGDLPKWVKFLWSNPHILINIFQYGFNNRRCSVRSCGIKFLDYYRLCGFNTIETDVAIGIGQSLQVQGHVNEYGLGYKVYIHNTLVHFHIHGGIFENAPKLLDKVSGKNVSPKNVKWPLCVEMSLMELMRQTWLTVESTIKDTRDVLRQLMCLVVHLLIHILITMSVQDNGDDEILEFQDGVLVVFSEIRGTTKLNDGKSRKVINARPYSFSHEEDTSNLIRLLCASIKKSVGEKIVPATDSRKQYYNKAQREMIENNRKDITVSMMKNYPLLLCKYVVDNAKIPSLVKIIVHMNIEIYSLKRHEQNSKTVLKLMREACFKHGEKDALRSCVKAINFCFAQSQGELKYFAQNKLKELEDELIAKLKSAIKEVPDGDDAYFLVILKRLYELQLSKPIPIEGVYEDIVNFLQNFRNMGDGVVLLLNMYLHVAWCMHSIINNETVPAASISSLWDKRNTLFVQLEHYLEPSSDVQEGGNFGNLLACRVCTILAESWCLFRKANLNSTKLESLGYCPNVSVLQRLWGLCEKHLNISDETEDEDANKEYVEETNRDAVIIAAAKLVAIDAVPKKYLGSEIISHFMMHGTNVVKIVKHLIVVLKKKDDNVSCIFLEALKRAYRRHLVVLSNSNYEEDVSLKSFQECKDLAAQLSGTVVGAAQSKIKQTF